jgi:hypothetical protein
MYLTRDQTRFTIGAMTHLALNDDVGGDQPVCLALLMTLKAIRRTSVDRFPGSQLGYCICPVMSIFIKRRIGEIGFGNQGNQ